PAIPGRLRPRLRRVEVPAAGDVRAGGLRLMSASDRGVAGKVASNTVWNLVHSVVSAVAGIVVSALTARYLGTTEFGVLSYILWLTGVVARGSGLGLDEGMRKPGTRWGLRGELEPWVRLAVWRRG